MAANLRNDLPGAGPGTGQKDPGGIPPPVTIFSLKTTNFQIPGQAPGSSLNIPGSWLPSLRHDNHKRSA